MELCCERTFDVHSVGQGTFRCFVCFWYLLGTCKRSVSLVCCSVTKGKGSTVLWSFLLSVLWISKVYEASITPIPQPHSFDETTTFRCWHPASQFLVPPLLRPRIFCVPPHPKNELISTVSLNRFVSTRRGSEF